jgi:hypothetical protein
MNLISFEGISQGEVDIQFNDWIKLCKPTQLVSFENKYIPERDMFICTVLYSTSRLSVVNMGDKH